MRKNKEEILKDKILQKDEEIKRLKEKLNETQYHLDMTKITNELLKAKTDEIINDCEEKVILLNDSLKELDELKARYKKALQDMKNVQLEQKKDYKQLVKKVIKKR